MKKGIIFLFLSCIFYTAIFAIAKIDSLNIELNTRTESEKIEIYNLLAEAYWYKSPVRTIEFGNIALELARKYEDREQEVTALINIGNGYMFTGNFQEAIDKYLTPGLKLSETIGYEKGMAGGLNSIAASYMNLGDYHKALNIFLRSLEILERIGESNKAARIKINIASLYTNWGNYNSAMDYYFEALKIFEEAGDEELMSRTLNNIAVGYHSWGNYDKALEYYYKSLELYSKLNDDLGRAIPLNNIGEIYKDRQKFDVALDYYLQSLELVQGTENKQSIGVALQGAGEALKGLKEYDIASDYLLRALENFTAIGFQEGVANSLYDLGDIHLIKNDEKKALEYLEKSLGLAESSEIKDLMQRNYLLLSDSYYKMEDYKRSLDYFRKYCMLKDSIFTEETSNKIFELDIKYNSAQKEKLIETLRGKNKIQKIYGTSLILGLMLLLIITVTLYILNNIKTKANRKFKEANAQIQKQKYELEKMNKELEELNATKNKFFSIIAHDLKNAFITLKTGSRLLSRDIDNFDRKTVKTLALELNDSAENLYQLLQNLLDWARVQTGKIKFNSENINLKSFLKDNMTILENIAKKKSISLIYKIDKDIVLTSDSNMLYSIFLSLINNAIKFSHPETYIEIRAKKIDNFAEISIKDQGIGIGEKVIGKLFRIDQHFNTVGTAKEKGSGLGLILCKEFIELHKGRINIKSKKGEGTEVLFTIPLA